MVSLPSPLQVTKLLISLGVAIFEGYGRNARDPDAFHRRAR